MTGGISIHVVDVSRGVVATDLRVEVFRVVPHELVASGAINAKGVLDEAALNARMLPGCYEAVFHVAEYYRHGGHVLPEVPFLDLVTYRFGISNADQHYHLPMKLTARGYSCFRGGA